MKCYHTKVEMPLFFWKWGPWEKDEVEAFLFFFQSPLLVDMTWSQVSDNSAISREKRWRRRSFEFEPINILPTVHNLASKFYTTYNCPREKHELVWTKLFKLLSVPKGESIHFKVVKVLLKTWNVAKKYLSLLDEQELFDPLHTLINDAMKFEATSYQ